MKKIVKYISLLLLLFSPISLNAYGLMFHRAVTTSEPRTGYQVFDEASIKFNNYFEIEFELEIYNTHSLGSIVKVLNDHKGDAFVLAFSYNDEHESFVKFNVEGKLNLFTATIDNDKLGRGKWQHIRLRFDLANKQIFLALGGETHRLENINLPDQFTPSITFGCFNYEETAAFSLRNLRVGNDVQSMKFPLNESAGEVVHDCNGHTVGKVTNPIWKVLESYHWQEIYRYTSSTVSGVNYDQVGDKFIVANKDSLVSFYPSSNEVRVGKYTNKCPVDGRLGTTFLDIGTNKLYLYEVNNLPAGDVTMAAIDLDEMRWESLTTQYLNTQRHHHTSYYNEVAKEYVIFGGFGNREYSNEFVVYDLKNNDWSQRVFTGDNITPRYSSSSATDSLGRLLIFGGLGNQTGDQTVGIDHFYDLYQVDFSSGEITCLWEKEPENYELVPVRKMIVSDDQKSIYAVCYPLLKPETELRLYKISIEDGSYSMLGDSIPILSQSIMTNANLYFNADRQEYYCTTQEFSGKSQSTLIIYALAAPAVSLGDLALYSSTSNYDWVIIISVFTFIVGCLGCYIWSKKRISEEVTQDMSLELEAGEDKPIDNILRKTNYVKLFGEFNVIDRAGKDITYMFSKKLSHLFVLLMVNSLSEEKGISSKALNKALWPDKSMRSANNLKGVTMSNLRKALEELDGVEIVYCDGLFKVKYGEQFNCDYFNMIRFTEAMKSSKTIEEGVLSAYVTTFNDGAFLLSFPEPFFDEIKSVFENLTLQVLPIIIDRLYRQSKYVHVLKLVSAIYTIDIHNEIALGYEIKSLVKLNKEDEAKKRYYFFKVSYQRNLDEVYPYSYEDMLTNNPISLVL